MKLTLCMPIAETRGGAETLLERLVHAAPAAGLDLSVVFLTDGPLANRLAEAGARTTVVNAGRLRDVGRMPAVVRAIAEAARAHQSDAIFSWMTKAHLYAAPAALLTGRPALWYQHGTPDPRDPVTRIATLLPAAGILACSDNVAQAQMALRPHRQTRAVLPCVDLAAFDPLALPSPSDARRQLGLPTSGPLVGMVARMQRWKGVHVYVDAMARVLSQRPSATGVIVGGRHALEPEYADALDAQIDALGLRGRIRRVGFQPNVPLWMQAMDIVVHASDREPFGMVVIEAMALGKAVVAGADGGPCEIITEGHDGFLAPYGRDDILADRIASLLTDPSLRNRMGAAARRRAAAFSTPAYASRFIDAVAHLLPRSLGTRSLTPSST
jgi:glycosyltransferase involved in cell wall biosynthesis